MHSKKRGRNWHENFTHDIRPSQKANAFSEVSRRINRGSLADECEAMNDAYTRELKKILTDGTPVPDTTMTRAENEAAIADISKQLTRPMNNVERLCLVEDRQRLRKQSAALK